MIKRMFSRLQRRQFLLSSLLFLASCTATSLEEPRSSPSATMRRDRPTQLRLAISDVKGSETLESEYGAFRDALAETLDLPVELVPVENHIAAVPALQTNQLDIVFAGPSEYLVLNARAQAKPIVAVTRPDYYTVFLVRADSDVQELADLAGKTIGIRTEGATASHIGSAKLLNEAGLASTIDYNIKIVGKQGLEQLLNGDIDALADSNSRITRYITEAGATANDVQVLAQGTPLPNDVFVLRGDLSPAFLNDLQNRMLSNQTKLLAAITAAPANQKFTQSEFVVTEDEDYNEVREMYVTLGLERLIQ